MECDICNKKFAKRYSLQRHLINIHNRPISAEKPTLLQFQSMEDFLQWKAKVEKETSSSYVSRTKVNGKNEVYKYYECCRSGIYAPKGKGQRRLKSQKSAKIGKKCPSRIRLKISESTYFVQFYKDHEGHGSDLEHLRLPSSFRAEVAGKLKEGVSMKRVIDDVRNQTIVDNTFGRVSLVNRKDLHNIARDFDVEHHRHKLDSVSVKLWVDEMTNDPNNPVIYFKQQGEEDQSGLLQKDDFALTIMTAYTSTETSSKNEEMLATIQCLEKMENFQERKTSVNLINKAHAFIEGYYKSSLTEEDEEKLNKHLDKMLTICANSQPSRVPTRHEIQSRKRKIEAQMPLFSTKKRNKNKKPLIKNPTNNESRAIKQSLLTDSQSIYVHTEFDHTY